MRGPPVQRYLPPAVTFTTDTTLSVGLPSLSASTHVPASFFSFSRPGLLAAFALTERRRRRQDADGDDGESDHGSGPGVAPMVSV